jgi:hypothetical protein
MRYNLLLVPLGPAQRTSLLGFDGDAGRAVHDFVGVAENGQCISPIGSTVTTTINARATPTLAIFATASGSVPFELDEDAVGLRHYRERTNGQGLQRSARARMR